MAVLKDLIVHGASRFINVAQYGSAKGGVIAADKGVFNKLIATSAEIDTLNVEELNADRLTAQNATVMGLLDVKGNLHTNSWTNSNIATIQGNFYIAPAVMTGTSSGDTGVTITAISNGSANNGYWTLALSGTNILTFPNLEADKATSAEEETSYNAWSPGSLVMVTGSIKKDGITYPLGTLKGELSGIISSNGVTVTKITDNLNTNPSTLQEYGEGTYGYVEIKISLYQRAYSNNLYPLGILMSAQGRASKSFIDIYGGGNKSSSGILQVYTHPTEIIAKTGVTYYEANFDETTQTNTYTRVSVTAGETLVKNYYILSNNQYIHPTELIAKSGVNYYSYNENNNTYTLESTTAGTTDVSEYYFLSIASSDYGGLTMPNVRIGNLRGLPSVLTGDFEDNAGLPTGWGIYTDNGFFKGTLVSTQGRLGVVDSYIDISDSGINIVGSTIIGTNVNLALDSVTQAVQPEDWNNTHVEYIPTEDTTKQDDKVYYTTYEKTSDSTIDDTTKIYYTRSGSGTTASPYIYTEVTSPTQSGLSNYYEYVDYKEYDVSANANPKGMGLYEYQQITSVTKYISSHLEFTSQGLIIQGNENEYEILLANDGMHVHKQGNDIATFGENIVFSGTNNQYIGDDNSYIRFTAAEGNNASTIEIAAQQLVLHSNITDHEEIDVVGTLVDTNAYLMNTENRLTSAEGTISTLEPNVKKLTGYVTINTSNSSIALGNEASLSRVFIQGGNDSKVAIQNKTNSNSSFVDVAYMKGDRFYAPSMVTTNLYMKAKDSSGELTGSIGWVMRTNSHLSLKLIS